MDELSQQIKELIEKFPNSEDFIRELDKRETSEEKKGDFFCEVSDRLYKVSNFKLALEVWNKALEYYLKFNDKAGESKCYRNLGETYRNFGEFKKAIEYNEKSLEICMEISDKVEKAKCYNNLGSAYYSLSNFRRAIEYYDEALKIAKDVEDRVVESKCYNNLGNAYFILGNLRMATEYREKSLEIAKKLGDKAEEHSCYLNLGIDYWSLGDFKKAKEYIGNALEIAKDIGNRAGESNCYMNLGSVYYSFGQFRKAIEYYEKALEIFENIGDKVGEAGCYTNVGVVYYSLGDFKRTIEHLEKASGIFTDIGDKVGESMCYINLGESYRNLGNFRKAIEYEEKGLAIKKAIGDKTGESICYIIFSDIYRNLDDFGRAIEYLEKSLEIVKDIKDKSVESQIYISLGKTYNNSVNFKDAIQSYEKALKILDEIEDIYHGKTCLSDIGKIYFDEEYFGEAERYYKQAVEILENMRKENIPPEYKRNFWKDNIPIFDNLIISEVKLSKREEALEYSEKGKGRTVFDYILGRGIEEQFKPEPLSLKEIQALAKSSEKNLVLFRVTEKGTFAFIVRSSPFASPTDKKRKGEGMDGFELLKFPEFNTKRLEELTVQLEAEKPVGGWIHAYSNYKSVTKKIRPLLLEEKVVEAGKILKQEEEKWFKTMDDTLKILYDELIGPVFKRFDKGEKVVIIPNRALNVLPLHACFYEEESPSPNLSHQGRGVESKPAHQKSSGKRRYLLDDYEISYAPNCNILDLCYKRELERNKDGAARRKDNLFAIANPTPPYNLAFSEWEVEEIGKLFDAKEVYIKEEVKDKLLEKMANYDVIHLSTHGIYDLSSSLNSKLLLGEDIDLTLEEIFDKIRIDKSWLVSLSACESGLVDYRDIADEYIGLQAGFLYAGAPTVIASLWIVTDYTTALVMIKTYENIFKDGLNKAEALRKAQLWLKELTAGEALEIIKSKELELEYSTRMAREDISPLRRAISLEDPESKPFAHPYYWAGFQIFGA